MKCGSIRQPNRRRSATTPSPDSRSVPELVASNSVSGSHSATGTELCVMLSGKPTLRPLSWRGWKTRPWIRLLSGTISDPSTAQRGVDAWTSSLRASRASRTATPENSAGTTTNERSGHTSSASSRSAIPRPSSLRTSRGSCDWPSLFGNGFEEWVSAQLRRCYTPPRKLARSRSGDECFSFSPAPTASLYGRSKGGQKPNGPERPSMNWLVEALPAPTARDGTPRGLQVDERGKRISRSGQRHSVGLPEAVHILPSPTAGDAKSSGAAGYSTASGRHSGTTPSDAVLGAASAGRRGRLSPLLSEWVMGWPIGWTDCDAPVTESFRSWLRAHSELFCGD